VRHDLFVRPAQMTFTFRNNISQTALPIRTWGAFLMPNGVGGAGVHWNAETWRFLPSDFVLKTHLTQRYGAKFLPEDMTIEDWGITYDELEATINAGRLAAATAERIQMQGGVPIHIGGTVVGAVGVSGFDKSKDVEIAETAAVAVK
jgi:choline dehydrogenase-like flavoprotein